MTDSPSVDFGYYNSISDMNDTNQLQTMGDKNVEAEYQLEEWIHYSFISDHSTMFLVVGIGMCLVSLIGIIGNILCAIVLSRPSMRTSTNIILFGLSVFDFMVVLLALVMSGIPWSIPFFCADSFESFYLTTLDPIIFTYLEPLFFNAQLGSTYFTMLVTVERFFVVYRPLMARPYCTNRNAIRASLAVAAFIIIFRMSTWWEHKMESVYDENGSWTKYRIIPLLWKNENYVLYYKFWVCMFILRIIPPALLTVLNISIYLKIRQANKMRESMTQVTSSEISLAKMLIWIVSIFLLCNLFELYMYMRSLLTDLEDTPQLIMTSYFLFNLNSAVNFIIYCLMGEKFRLVFLELFWPKKLRGRWRNNVPRNADGVSGTTSTQLSPTNSTTKV